MAASCRATWDEVNEIIAAANAYTAKTYGPDRIIGFSPIPAMSMVSYAAGLALPVADRRRLHVVLRLVLRPAAGRARRPGASRPTCRKVGRLVQARLTSSYGARNVPQTRTPDAHFYTEVRYKGAKIGRRQPRLRRRPPSSPTSGCAPKQGTDAALAHGDGPRRSCKEFHLDRARAVFQRLRPPLHRHADAGARSSERDGRLRPGPLRCAPPTSPARLGETNNPEWKTVRLRRDARALVVRRAARSASAGASSGKWNLEDKDARRPTRRCGLVAGRRSGDRDRRGRLPVLRRHRRRSISSRPGTTSVLIAHVAGHAGSARRRRDRRGRHRVRPDDRQLRHRSRASAAAMSRGATTTTRRTRRPGRRRSPA
jgi:hypothetical protein